MKYAEVAVNSSIAQRRSFCYTIPSWLDIDIGYAVWVPFGSAILQGIVVKVSDIPSFEITKDIVGTVASSPLVSEIHIKLASWISSYYLAPLFDSIALMLPPGFEQRSITSYSMSPDFVDMSLLNGEQQKLVQYIQNKQETTLDELKTKLGKQKISQLTRQLLQLGIIQRNRRLSQVRVKPKLVRYLALKLKSADIKEVIHTLNQLRAYKQAAVVRFLAEQAQPVSIAEVKRSTECTASVINSLRDRDILAVVETQVRRDPLVEFNIIPTLVLNLTPMQEKAFKQISEGLERGERGKPSIFLLHGVTGSGKTELYLRAFDEVIKKGKRGICLVPEIALTPQMIERFAARFPGRIAVLHSDLSLGEQFDEWHRIREGNCDVVIGPRSALFAPQPDLGLIVIDEEHEWTYKQSDRSPRYHAREAALMLAKLTGAAVILGSATPDIETYYRAKQGVYRLIELAERITPGGLVSLPEVEIVDMREEIKAGNRNLFSTLLLTSMREVLARHEQIILFLNRRGTATIAECKKCGSIINCKHCSASMVYHASVSKLVCHRCRYTRSFPMSCPNCLENKFRLLGIGTQRVEEEVKRTFPEACILRWDRDAITGYRVYKELLDKFKNNEADILIGTQMVAKGLDLPGVTLSGVVSADTGLNIPDFRACERVFQLLCQVAGRSGRGFTKGKVVFQTYSPEHYAITTAASHDYALFYQKEISYRREFGYPPFSRLVRLIYSHKNADVCRTEMERVCRIIINERDRRGIPHLRLIGPSPAFTSRLHGYYRWQAIICGSDPVELLDDIIFPQGWIIDIDPVGVV